MSYQFFLGTGGAPPPPTTWTLDRVLAMQGDMMVWCPELRPTFSVAAPRWQGDDRRFDPILKFYNRGDRGRTPYGIIGGYVWSPFLINYSPAQRQTFYQAIKAMWPKGAAPLQVAQLEVGPGYGEVAPIDQAMVDTQGPLLNTIAREMAALDLVPIGMGCSATVPPAAGLDPALFPFVCDDWDNTNSKDCNLAALSRYFPKALVLSIERPANCPRPDPDACSPVPFPTSGGTWIHDLQRKYPNFLAVLHEVDPWASPAEMIEDLRRANVWYHDLLEFNFEQYTYLQFWESLSPDHARATCDQITAALPQLKGYMAGGTYVPPPPPQGLYVPADAPKLDLAQCQPWVCAPDIASWPETVSLAYDIRSDDTYFNWVVPPTWPEVSFGVQFSLGMAVEIAGQWYCSAPIECWTGKPSGGGPILNADQIGKYWFQDQRWGPMEHHQPKSGDRVALFIAAGDQRNGITGVQGRSAASIFVFP